jgi:hypothetical protein
MKIKATLFEKLINFTFTSDTLALSLGYNHDVVNPRAGVKGVITNKQK